MTGLQERPADDVPVGDVRGARAADTRATLLAAARAVFTASGFSEASIADVVTAAGASVGSLYHHFGGKADLYVALFEVYQAGQAERAAAAVAAARTAGEFDPAVLFLAGARAYLEGCWSERDLARLYLAGGGPPGFELVVRRGFREWARQNAVLLHADTQTNGEALMVVLTTVISAGGHEVSLSEDEAAAMLLVDEIVAILGRIGNP